MLAHDKTESARFKKAYPVSDGDNVKFYYMSLARSVNSTFFKHMLGENSVIFKIDGRKINNFGKVVPFNYFSGSMRRDVDEMEDRLVSDRPDIPTSCIIEAHVVVKEYYLEQVKRAIDEMPSHNYPIYFYSSKRDALTMSPSKRVKLGDLTSPESDQTAAEWQDEPIWDEHYEHVIDYLENNGSAKMRDFMGFQDLLKTLRARDRQKFTHLMEVLIKHGFKTAESLSELEQKFW